MQRHKARRKTEAGGDESPRLKKDMLCVPPATGIRPGVFNEQEMLEKYTITDNPEAGPRMGP